MRYIIRATRTSRYESGTVPFGHVVYDGSDFKKAKDAFLKHTEFGGVQFISERD